MQIREASLRLVSYIIGWCLTDKGHKLSDDLYPAKAKATADAAALAVKEG